MDVSGIHTLLEHKSPHRMVVGLLEKDLHGGLNIRWLISGRWSPEHVSELLKQFRDLGGNSARRPQAWIGDVVLDVEWIAGYGGALVVYTSAVEK